MKRLTYWANGQLKTVRIRIYSKLMGNQDFCGPESNQYELEHEARQAVAAYLAAGIKARFIGQV